MQEKLTEALEDYLEMIFIMIEQNGKATVTELSRSMNVKKSSVHSAVSRLKKMGLVVHERYSDIVLTSKGLEEAERIKDKNTVLYRFFKDVLFLDEKTAKDGACRIEHAVSYEVLEKLVQLHLFIEESDKFNKKDWKEYLKNFRK